MKSISSLLYGVTTFLLMSMSACKSPDTSLPQDSNDAKASTTMNHTLPNTANNDKTDIKKVSVDSNDDNDIQYSDSTYIPLPTIDKPVISNSSQVEPATQRKSGELVASEVARNLELSQAKLAAKSHDICPKLLFSEVDSPVIERPHEVLKSDYCDYYIYPRVGSRINVQSEPNVVRAVLVSPVMYDFLNGSYVVDKIDKHVIRLYYTGTEFRNQPLTYNISLTID